MSHNGNPNLQTRRPTAPEGLSGATEELGGSITHVAHQHRSLALGTAELIKWSRCYQWWRQAVLLRKKGQKGQKEKGS